MDGCYYRHNYGAGADEKPFRNRGIAKLLVGMVQSYLDCMVHSKILLCHCLMDGSNGQGSLWNSLGFQKVCPFQDNYDEAHEFVQPFLTFITQNDQKKILMMIDRDVKFFYPPGELTCRLLSEDRHQLFHEPFVIKEIEFNPAMHSYHQLANFIFLSESDVGGVYLPMNICKPVIKYLQA
jgi:hypothetical protein